MQTAVGKDTKASGPCAQCAHMREGRSLAYTAFPLLLHAMQPATNSAQQRAADDEKYALSGFQRESEDFRRTGTGEWRRPPTDRSFSYCGLDEFQQRFYACEVKNKDQSCSDFLPDGSRSRTCKSCVYNRVPSDRVYQTLIQALSERQQAQRIRSDVDMTLQSQASGEFKQCVDLAGFLSSRPGLLPICEKYSSSDDRTEAHYVVGPIANAGNSCAHWSEGTNAASQESLARLEALLERAKRALALAPPPAPVGVGFTGTTYSESIQRVQELRGNAKADIVEYCLLMLGVDPGYAASVATTFVADVWFGSRTPGGVQAALAEIEKGETPEALAPATPSPATQSKTVRRPEPRGRGPTVTNAANASTAAPAFAIDQGRDAGSTPTQPGVAPAGPPQAELQQQWFQVQPNIAYQHPANPGIRLFVTPQPPNGVASVVLPNGMPIQFDLGAFQPGVWTPLLSPMGPLPVMLNVQLPNAVFALWS
jgi:hypothetical protein